MQLTRMPTRLTRQTYIDTRTWSKKMNMICTPIYRFPFLHVNFSIIVSLICSHSVG